VTCAGRSPTRTRSAQREPTGQAGNRSLLLRRRCPRRGQDPRSAQTRHHLPRRSGRNRAPPPAPAVPDRMATPRAVAVRAGCRRPRILLRDWTKPREPFAAADSGRLTDGHVTWGTSPSVRPHEPALRVRRRQPRREPGRACAITPEPPARSRGGERTLPRRMRTTPAGGRAAGARQVAPRRSRSRADSRPLGSLSGRLAKSSGSRRRPRRCSRQPMHRMRGGSPSRLARSRRAPCTTPTLLLWAAGLRRRA
jgi:hypothetical protein